ncbi:MAG TPA: hypothetical protein VE870_08825 [Bacteroidales bacterium]|nr:hypothetical protein [Bacteroidales bacterium]
METETIIETRGIIVKEENVQTIKFNILRNTFVLESTNPMPGYYGENTPDTEKPRSVFIILDKKYDQLFLARRLKDIGRVRDFKCFCGYGHITIGQKMFYCVRIKNLGFFSSIPSIQSQLEDSGVGLMKAQDIKATALIEIHKSFLISPVSGGIFKDRFDPDRYYIELPSEMSWNRFKELTHQIKLNMDNNQFDAAMGIIFLMRGPMDVVRVYDKNNEAGRMEEIQRSYLLWLAKEERDVKSR